MPPARRVAGGARDRYHSATRSVRGRGVPWRRAKLPPPGCQGKERAMKRVLVGLTVCLMIAAGCGPSAAPAPAAGSPPAPQAPAASSPSPAGAAAAQDDDAYRQRVIDGARAEGQVNAAIQSAWTPDGIKQLEEAVQREYGVA